jgi:hypothetical protein
MMRSISYALCFVAVAAPVQNVPGSRTLQPIAQASPAPVAGGESALDRFLADRDQRLVSYSALRKLSVVARGGKMTAQLTARTTLDPVHGFAYEVLEESGSEMLRNRVLRGVLEAERDAKQREEGEHGALTRANYKFSTTEVTEDGLVRVGISPKRKDALLVEGSILLTNDGADLIRMEGLLVKRPSFWTRKVQIVRSYGRIGGVRVPLTTGSIAEVLFAGQSTFKMDYAYESINDTPVAGVPVIARR